MRRYDLDIQFENNLSFEELTAGISRDSSRVKRSDPDFVRLVIEVEDLFRRLFCNCTNIVIGRVTPSHGKTGVVRVYPFSRESHDEQVIVKYGDFRAVDREYANYEEFVKGKIGIRATSVLTVRRTPLLGGIVYSLIGTPVEKVIDLAEYYRRRSAREVGVVLDNLFKDTCANWYTDRGMVQHIRLDETYSAALEFSSERLLEALKDKFPYYRDQRTLTFRDLPGVHVPNPAFAAQGKTLARRTYLCTTHGDLNANNVLIDPEGHTWLIDFYRTGKGPILRDCVLLETVVKFVLLDEAELSRCLELERALMSMARFKDLESLHYDPPNETCAKAFAVCHKVRQIARDLVQPSDDFSEYEIGLLFCSMNTQRFYSLPKVNRLHALLSAGLLCERLGLESL